MRMTNQAAPLSVSDGGAPSSIEACGVLVRAGALYRDAGDAADALAQTAQSAPAAPARAAPEHLRAPKYRRD
ncbi:MAG TPA: hypothetical protein VIH96_05760, partial [Paraburkholderia sp.]